MTDSGSKPYCYNVQGEFCETCGQCGFTECINHTIYLRKKRAKEQNEKIAFN